MKHPAVRPAEEVMGPLVFEDLFEGEYRRLGTALYLLVGDRSEAEELAQEAFARVFQRWSAIREMSSPTGYLYRTALNLVRKRAGRLARQAQREVERRAMDDPIAVADRRLVVRAAVAGLSREQREALVLVEWLELDSAEAGAVLGISADSVRARTHRARDALKALLEDEEDA